MKILVYGAGVQGSVFAAHLHRGGHDVSILARGRRLVDIREHGIVLEQLGVPGQQVERVPPVERLDPTDAYDLALVMMQKGQVGDVLPILAANDRVPTVAFFMNNAAGPDELVLALGAERVVLGFGLMGGVRDGSVIRWASGEKGPHLFDAVVGEMDGSVTPRLQGVIDALEEAGIRVEAQPDIDAWLKAHWALVGPIAQALNLVGNDNYRLAEDRDTLRLMVRAQRQGLRALRALGLPLAPPKLKLVARMPTWVSAAITRKILKTEFAKLALSGHATAGHDEFAVLDKEFRKLIEKASLPTPALDELYRLTRQEERTPADTGGE